MERSSRHHRHILRWLVGVPVTLFVGMVMLSYAIYAATGSLTSVHGAGYHLGVVVADALLLLLVVLPVALLIWGVVALFRRWRR